MNNEWLNAYVLHRRPYRETSYIVDFFTLEEGRVSAVAKGVKNSKSDKKSLLQPFQHLRLQLSGKSELKNLRHVESVSPSINLVGTALFCAMYVNELTNRVMPAGLASDGGLYVPEIIPKFSSEQLQQLSTMILIHDMDKILPVW